MKSIDPIPLRGKLAMMGRAGAILLSFDRRVRVADRLAQPLPRRNH
jgi:hypothetical protein